MTHLRLFIVFQIIALTLFATEPKVKLSWSLDYTLPKKYFDVGFVGNPQIGYVQVSHNFEGSLALDKFSPTLKHEGEKLKDYRKIAKEYNSEMVCAIGGKYYWLYGVKTGEKENLYAQEIDVQKGDFAGEPKLLLTCPKPVVEDLIYSISSPQKEKYNIFFAKDSSKMYVSVKYPNASKINAKNIEEYGFWGFDKNLAQVWSKPSVKMPYTEAKLNVLSFHGDKAGNFYVLGRVFNDETVRQTVDGKINFHFEVLKYSSNADGKFISFNTDEKYVYNIKLVEDYNSNLFCAGTYVNLQGKKAAPELKSAYDGSFVFKLNTSLGKAEKVGDGFYEMPTAVFGEYEDGKTAKAVSSAIASGEDIYANNIDLENILVDKDGGIVIVCEQGGTEFRSSSMTIYHNEDVYVQYISTTGKPSWSKKVPKHQLGNNSDFGLGVRAISANGICYLLFLDNMKNAVPVKDKEPEMHGAGWGGILMSVRLDATGDMKKTVLFDTKTVKNRIDIMKSSQIADGILIDQTQYGTVATSGLTTGRPSKVCLMNFAE